MGDALAGLVLDGLPGAVVAVDTADRVIAWNGAAEQMFGWSADEVLGRRLPHVPERARREREDRITEVMSGRPVEFTTQRLHRDGRVLDVTLQLAVLRDERGEVAGHVVLCRDATLRLQLQRSEAELQLVRRLSSLVQRLLRDLDLGRVLQAIVEVAVDLLDLETGVISLEKRPGEFVRMANVNVPDGLVGYPVRMGEGLHGRVLATGKPLVVDDYDSWPDAVADFTGHDFHASMAVPIQGPDRVIGALSVHSTRPDRIFGNEEADVLALLAEYAAVAIANATAFRRVASERERFLALVEAMPDGLAVIEDGVVTAWNQAASRLTGHAPAAVIGAPPPIDLDAAADGLEVAVDDGRTWLETVRSDLPHVDGRVYLLRDMTTQRDLDRAKDLFFATTSHELKTPLTVVKGLASTLHRHWDRMSDAHRVEALETIERRAESLDRLIERILVGSRVQAGAFHAAATPVDLRPVVEDMVRGMDAATGPEHAVRSNLPDGLPRIAADRQAMETILGHLLENAIKYSPDGGEVLVEAEAAGDDVVEVRVLDEGVGIEGDIEPMLAAFVQGDSRTTRRFGGVGLGLYIVGELVRAQGGTITATRRATGGSCFTFTVPVWR